MSSKIAFIFCLAISWVQAMDFPKEMVVTLKQPYIAETSVQLKQLSSDKLDVLVDDFVSFYGTQNGGSEAVVYEIVAIDGGKWWGDSTASIGLENQRQIFNAMIENLEQDETFEYCEEINRSYFYDTFLGNVSIYKLPTAAEIYKALISELGPYTDKASANVGVYERVCEIDSFSQSITWGFFVDQYPTSGPNPRYNLVLFRDYYLE